MTPDAVARAGRSARNEIVVDPRSRGGARVGEADHRRLTYRPELDGIRAIAVLLVIANHAGLLPDSAGTAGVTAFFVLSGYLITSLLIGERAATGRIDLRAFYVRRARRLLPALAALLVGAGAWMAIRGELGTYLPQSLAAGFYAADFATILGLDLGQLSHTWSLSLEEQFYAIWPAVFILVRRPRPWLVAAALIAAGSQLVIPDGVARFITRADGLALGCLFAFAPVASRWWPLAWLAFAGVALTDVPFFAMTIASAGLLATAAAAPLLRTPLLVRVGQISYGLYLWHFVVLAAIAPWPLAVVATFAIALASERWIELPFRRRRLRVLDHLDAQELAPRRRAVGRGAAVEVVVVRERKELDLDRMYGGGQS